MFLLDNKPLPLDQPFTHPTTGVRYPANWLRLSSLAEKHEIGIVEVPDPVDNYDQRFYWGPNNPKDHGQLVELWTQQTRTTANTLLAPTDWMVVRELDNGTTMDPAWKDWRQAVRLAANEKVLYIGTTNDTDDLAAYITGSAYPVWPSDPNAPVVDALADGVELASDQPA